MTTLEIQLLGEPRIRRAGAPVPLPASKKTRGLLGYLVAAAEAVPRGRLCELFWEGPVDPKAELRWSLAKLRPLLDERGTTRLVADRERVAFAREGAQVDLDALRGLAAAGVDKASGAQLEAAAARFRGEFLEGLDLADCYRFDQWLIAERERWRRLRVALLQTLCSRAADQPAEALRHARTWAGLDPLDERAHAAVVRALGRLGRGREALAQYETGRRILRQELAASPGEALEEARRALRAAGHDRAPASPTPMASRATERAAPPFQGRSLELDTLLATLAGVGTETASLALVAGEPGIGKTRLLSEFARRATAAGAAVLYGRAYEAEMVRPYGPWIDALRSIPVPPPAAAWRADLAPLLPELGLAVPEASRLFDGVAHWLAEIAAATAARLVVVVLDDLQWMDEASVALLHYLLRSLNDGHVVFACGARAAELGENIAASSFVNRLLGAGRLMTVPIGPLDGEATAALVASVGPRLDARQIFAESEGNPLFTLEIARSLVKAGTQGGPGDAWPESLTALLGERIADLGEAGARLLPWAAALGRSFGAELLARASGVDTGDLVSGIEDLERHGVLRAAAGGAGYDFAHDLLRRAAYRSVSEPRRRLIHGRIAAAFTAAEDGAILAGDVAHHAALGGDSRLAAASYLEAGERSLRLAALAEARELAERGIQHLTNLPRVAALPLHVGLLSVFVRAGRGRERDASVEATLDSLVEEARAAGLHPQVQTALYLIATLNEEQGNPAGAARQVMRAVEEAGRADPATAARALGNTGRCLAQIDREHARAERLLLEAAELARQADIEVIDVPWGLGLVRHHTGDGEGAAQALSEAVALARRGGDHWSEAQCRIRLAMIDLETAPTGEVARLDELHAVAAKLGDGSEAAVAAALEALSRRRTALEDGEADLERAFTALRVLDTKGALAWSLNVAAAEDFAAGRVGAAQLRASEALAAAESVGRRGEIALARAALGQIALGRGDRAAAIAQVAALARERGEEGDWSSRARQAVDGLERALGADVPTPRPTISPTTAK